MCIKYQGKLKNNYLIYRTVGKYIHFLNCSSGRAQSFGVEDGNSIIENIERPEILKEVLSKDTFSFLFDCKKRMTPKLLRSSLLELGGEFSFPTMVNIELNRRCVLRCKHCYIPFSDLNNHDLELFDMFSIKEIKDLFNRLKEMGVFIVILTGGEPFLNRNFKIFLDEADRQGFVIEVFSNLQSIPDWFLNSDHKYRINRFQTSVYSVDPAVHDQVTSKKGSLKYTLRNLSALKRLGYRVEVATPLMSVNFETREMTKQYFVKRHINQSFAWPIINEYYDGGKGKYRLNISKEQFLEFVGENPGYILCPDFTGSKYICGAGRILFSISANGDVFPCSQFPKKMGNIKEKSVDEIMKCKQMCDLSCVSPSLIRKEEYTYNFCMGDNYSETGDPLKVPEFLNEMYKHYEEHIAKKGGEK